MGTFISPDTLVPDPGVVIDYNRYAYTRGNPLKYNDPSGHIVETVWDAANVAIGVGSLGYNLWHGNWGDAALDAGGLVLDVGATVIPVIPGGAATAIKASRAAAKVTDAVSTSGRAGDAVRTLYHGTNASSARKIAEQGIDLTKGRKRLDFNPSNQSGFYVTESLEQAQDWARRAGERYDDNPAVMIYEISSNQLSHMAGKVFDSGNSAWSDFVVQGRRNQLEHGFDYVEGPMLANPKSAARGLKAARAQGHQLAIFSRRVSDLFDSSFRGFVE